MSKIEQPEPVKLVIGIIFNQDHLFVQVKEELTRKYGELDLESLKFRFTYTDYYREEMGEILWKKFLSFKSLISPAELVPIKIFTNKLEEKFFVAGTAKRRVNIDPGYLSLAKLVLATGKDFAHRIYLNQGIYAEVTLRYSRHEGFKPWEWTYPDYKSKHYLELLEIIRSIYRNQIEQLKSNPENKNDQKYD